MLSFAYIPPFVCTLHLHSLSSAHSVAMGHSSYQEICVKEKSTGIRSHYFTDDHFSSLSPIRVPHVDPCPCAQPLSPFKNHEKCSTALESSNFELTPLRSHSPDNFQATSCFDYSFHSKDYPKESAVEYREDLGCEDYPLDVAISLPSCCDSYFQDIIGLHGKLSTKDEGKYKDISVFYFEEFDKFYYVLPAEKTSAYLPLYDENVIQMCLNQIPGMLRDDGEWFILGKEDSMFVFFLFFVPSTIKY